MCVADGKNPAEISPAGFFYLSLWKISAPDMLEILL